jgi:hypothetical protein
MAVKAIVKFSTNPSAVVETSGDEGTSKVNETGVRQYLTFTVEVRGKDGSITPFELPNAVVLNIFKFLEAKDLGVIRRVNHTFSVLGGDDSLWRKLMHSAGFVIPKNLEIPKDPNCSERIKSENLYYFKLYKGKVEEQKKEYENLMEVVFSLMHPDLDESFKMTDRALKHQDEEYAKIVRRVEKETNGEGAEYEHCIAWVKRDRENFVEELNYPELKKQKEKHFTPISERFKELPKISRARDLEMWNLLSETLEFLIKKHSPEKLQVSELKERITFGAICKVEAVGFLRRIAQQLNLKKFKHPTSSFSVTFPGVADPILWSIHKNNIEMLRLVLDLEIVTAHEEHIEFAKYQSNEEMAALITSAIKAKKELG